MARESVDLHFIVTIFPKLLQALPVTLQITVLAVIFGWAVGLLITFGKVSRFRVLSWLLSKVTTVLRGIPTIVLIYLVYFGLPTVVLRLLGISIGDWPKQVFVIIALAAELAVSSSEMFRSAYNSLEKGQLEAAHAIGMTRVQRFFHIILPQGLYVILPNLGSATLSLIQGTALVYTLGIMDIMGRARILDTNAFGLKTFEAYFAAAILYWMLSLFVSGLFRSLERKFGRGMRTVGAAQS